MIYLIDFENVHEEGFSALGRLGDKDAVYCFFTRNVAKISMSALAGMRSGQLHFIEAESGKQSLDLALVSYLGYLIGTKPQELYYDIVSNDNGFSKVAEFWNKRGNGLRVRIRKTNDLKQKAEAKQPSPATVALNRRQLQQTPRTNEQENELLTEREDGAADAERKDNNVANLTEGNSPEMQKNSESGKQPQTKQKGRQRQQRQRINRQNPVKQETPAKDSNETSVISSEPSAKALNTDTQAAVSETKPKEQNVVSTAEATGLSADAIEFIQEQAEKYRADKNMKQLVYRAVVKKYGQKIGTQIYNNAKKILLK